LLLSVTASLLCQSTYSYLDTVCLRISSLILVDSTPLPDSPNFNHI
jgi:hypothetical protein